MCANSYLSDSKVIAFLNFTRLDASVKNNLNAEINSAPTVYKVSATDFYNPRIWLNESVCGLAKTVHIQACSEPMRQLIKRYDLSNCNILSVGPGRAHEEFWFNESGAQLTLVDLCQNFDSDDMPSFLKTLSAINNGLTYIVGDCAEFTKTYKGSQFDVIYLSSFEPDELRREDIQLRFRETRSEEQRMAAPYVTWPKDEFPFMDMVMATIPLLKDGGLFFHQSYRGGADVVENPGFVEAMRTQLQQNGVELAELYCFRKSPGIILLVGIKGDQVSALSSLREIQKRPELTTFHGRYPHNDLKNDIIKIFDLYLELAPSV